MDYDSAVNLMSDYYGAQMEKITQCLSRDAIIALGQIRQQGVERRISNMTLVRLSTMEPYKQVGYITNPLMQFLIDKCCNTICTPSSAVTETVTKSVAPTGKSKSESKPNTNSKPKPEPIPEPEPEPDDDGGVEFDLFG